MYSDLRRRGGVGLAVNGFREQIERIRDRHNPFFSDSRNGFYLANPLNLLPGMAAESADSASHVPSF